MKRISSKIDKVVIYRSGAMVSRTGHVSLTVGMNRVRMDNLPATVNRESVQVLLPEGVRCEEVTFRVRDAKEKRELEGEESAKARELEDRIRLLSIKLQVNEAKYKTLTEHSYPPARDAVDLDYLRQYLDYVADTQQTLLENNSAWRRESEELTKQLSEITGDTERGRKLRGTLVLDIFAETDMVADIETRYQISGVTWTPVYEIVADNPANQMAIRLKAQINQKTGEDWDDTALTLSTGNLTLANTRHKLAPWIIQSRIAPPQPQFAAAAPAGIEEPVYGSMAVEPIDDVITASPPLARSAPNPANTFSDNNVSMEYELDGRFHITSDEDSVVEINERFVPAEYLYYITPKLERKAFLTASVPDGSWQQLRLLDCNASIFLENSYVGTTRVTPPSVEDKFTVSFGRDNSISVERDMLQNSQSKSMVGSRVNVDYRFEIRIISHKADTVNAIVEDQLPLSRDSRIKVEIRELTGAELDETTGKLTWRIKLEPEKKITLAVWFRVIYPREMNIRI